MNKHTLILMALCVFCLLPVQAQRRQHARKSKAATAVTKTPENPLFKSMLPSTAKVMFIDSMVVEKDSFLSLVPLNKESGTLFERPSEQGTVGYLNEFRNRCYFSAGDTISGRKLYTRDLLGNKWSQPTQLSSISDDYKNPDYPFMMADGITLFFSAQGEKSMGGYDIFTTLFDSDKGEFYEPENYGLPFNSKYNDYLLAIDDLDTLGWLVSDRWQPEGKVCIYTFVPTNPRQSFETDNLTDEEILPYARLQSISETWHFGDQKAAMARLHAMLRRSASQSPQDHIGFVVNDDVTYQRIDEFRSDADRRSFLELQGLKSSLSKKRETLEKQRDAYASASKNTQAGMRQVMLRAEHEIDELSQKVALMEKQIRNNENKLLSK